MITQWLPNYHANKQEKNAYFINKNIAITKYKNGDTTIIKPNKMYTPIKNGDTITLDYTDPDNYILNKEYVTIKYINSALIYGMIQCCLSIDSNTFTGAIMSLGLRTAKSDTSIQSVSQSR